MKLQLFPGVTALGVAFMTATLSTAAEKPAPDPRDGTSLVQDRSRGFYGFPDWDSRFGGYDRSRKEEPKKDADKKDDKKDDRRDPRQSGPPGGFGRGGFGPPGGFGRGGFGPPGGPGPGADSKKEGDKKDDSKRDDRSGSRGSGPWGGFGPPGGFGRGGPGSSGSRSTPPAARDDLKLPPDGAIFSRWGSRSTPPAARDDRRPPAPPARSEAKPEPRRSSPPPMTRDWRGPSRGPASRGSSSDWRSGFGRDRGSSMSRWRSGGSSRGGMGHFGPGSRSFGARGHQGCGGHSFGGRGHAMSFGGCAVGGQAVSVPVRAASEATASAVAASRVSGRFRHAAFRPIQPARPWSKQRPVQWAAHGTLGFRQPRARFAQHGAAPAFPRDTAHSAESTAR